MGKMAFEYKEKQSKRYIMETSGHKFELAWKKNKSAEVIFHSLLWVALEINFENNFTNYTIPW